MLGIGIDPITVGNTYVFNPLYQIAPGVGSGSRIGRKIQNAYMTLRVRYSHHGENAAGINIAQSSRMRVLHLHSKVVDTAAVASALFQLNPGGMAVGDIFRHVGAGVEVFSEVDTNRWKVLSDRIISAHRWYNEDQTTGTVAKFMFPLGKKVTYRDDTVNAQVLGGQHYIVIVGGFHAATPGAPGVGDRAGSVSPVGTIRWTDA